MTSSAERLVTSIVCPYCPPVVFVQQLLHSFAVTGYAESTMKQFSMVIALYFAERLDRR